MATKEMEKTELGTREDYALMAHLMRRAGFGATWEELGVLVAQGYEETVEQLLDPQRSPPADAYLLYRYHPTVEIPGGNAAQGQANWLYHMLNSKRPLEEKIALFWHYVFATGNNKVDNCNHLLDQIQMFRDHGMGNYRDLLVRLAKDPAMIYWLDNLESHKHAPNENWGRELLELFSMGVGNYTEKDVFEVSRAFTGWTMTAKMPRYPYGRFPWHFQYRPEDHDDTEKTFLGHTGNFGGEDIIDIIVQQPACHRFIARHLYNYFVADEPQVPAWSIEPARDEEAIKVLSDTFVSSGFEIKPVLRTLFNSDFFKSKAARFQKVKSPIEVVVGTVKLVKEFEGPVPYLEAEKSRHPSYMGQDILDPPSVEGWHYGTEWINSGSLVTRINYVAERVGNPEMPGVKEIIDRIAASNGTAMSAEAFVDRCLEQMGLLEVEESTRHELVGHAEGGGPISADNSASFPARVSEMLALIASTREYQFG